MLMSALRRSTNARMWVTVISCMGILMSLSAISYFGVIVNYLYSYYQTNTPTIVNLDPLWMLTTYQVVAPFGMMCGSSYASKYLGNVGAVVLYVIINVMATFAGFYSIGEPLALLGTYGILQGFCSGALFNLVWKICMSCAAGPVSGTATGIMGAGTPLGALAISELSLLVVNPGNQKRESESGNIHYFTDPDLLDRVPYMFVMNGAFCVVIHFTSVLFLCISASAARQAGDDDIDGFEKRLEKGSGQDYGTFVPDEEAKPLLSHASAGASKTDSIESGNLRTSSKAALTNKHLIINNTEQLTKRTLSFNASMNEEFQGSVAVTEDNNTGLRPREMIRTGAFWNLWVVNSLLNVSLYIYMNLYKEFGVAFFNDDALLTNAGVLAYACMVITRPLFGLLVDRKGVKTGLMFLTSTSTIFILLTMLTLYTRQPVAFVIVVICQINCISTLWLVFNYASKEAFGAAHYSANSAVVFTATIPPYIACAAVLPWLVANLGMMYVFMLASIFAGISFFMSLFYPSFPSSVRLVRNVGGEIEKGGAGVEVKVTDHGEGIFSRGKDDFAGKENGDNDEQVRKEHMEKELIVNEYVEKELDGNKHNVEKEDVDAKDNGEQEHGDGETVNASDERKVEGAEGGGD